MRINWFTPVPPVKSTAVDHTVQFLPRLLERFDLTLWTCQTEWDRDLARRVPIRYLDPYKVRWDEFNRADQNIYQIANNSVLHGTIWDISRRHPGIAIIHDLNLHDLISGWYRLHDRLEYLLQMQRYYGRDGLRDGDRFWEDRLPADFMAKHYLLTSLGAQNALGVLVHRQDVFEQLRQDTLSHIAYVPLKESIDTWLEALTGLIDNTGRIQSERIAYHLTQRTGAELSLWMTPATRLLGLQRVAEEINLLASEAQAPSTAEPLAA